MKQPFKIENIIRVVKDLDEKFVKEKKTGHFVIKAGYYEGGRAGAVREVSDSIEDLKTE